MTTEKPSAGELADELNYWLGVIGDRIGRDRRFSETAKDAIAALRAPPVAGADDGVREALDVITAVVEYLDFYEFQDTHPIFSEYAEGRSIRLQARHFRALAGARADDGVREALQAVWDDWATAHDCSGAEDYEIKDVSVETVAIVKAALASPPSVRLVERAPGHISEDFHSYWDKHQVDPAHSLITENAANATWHAAYAKYALSAEQPLTTVERENRCPKCGDLPTYQTPDGIYWDGNAHFWRVPAEQPRSEGSKP